MTRLLIGMSLVLLLLTIIGVFIMVQNQNQKAGIDTLLDSNTYLTDVVPGEAAAERALVLDGQKNVSGVQRIGTESLTSSSVVGHRLKGTRVEDEGGASMEHGTLSDGAGASMIGGILTAAELNVSGSVGLGALTPHRIVQTNVSGHASSVNDLTAWILQGSPSRVLVTDNGDGRATLSLPQDIHTGASPTFTGATLSGLTASRLMATNGLSGLSSVATLSTWLAGTANQVTVTDDGDGSATLSLPQNIHTGASPTFAGATLSGLTASRLMATNGLSGLSSVVTLSTWLAGTANQVTVTDDGDGSATLSLPQNIHTGASPTFAAATLSGLTASRLMATDGLSGLASVATLSTWLAGTANQVTVTDDGDGSATLSLPQNIHTGASPTFAGATLSGLTASRLMATDGLSGLASVATLSTWLAGTANQVTVTDDGDGSATLSLPQNIHTGASPTFAGATLSGLTASRLMATDGLSGLASVATLSTWLAGTANQVTVTDDGDGSATLSLPQDIHTGASPTFAGLTMAGTLDLGGNNVVNVGTTINGGNATELNISANTGDLYVGRYNAAGKHTIIGSYDAAGTDNTFIRSGNATTIQCDPSQNVNFYGSYMTLSAGATTVSHISTGDITGGLIVSGGSANDGAHIELFASSHAGSPSTGYYDMTVHNFRNQAGTANFMTLLSGSINTYGDNHQFFSTSGTRFGYLTSGGLELGTTSSYGKIDLVTANGTGRATIQAKNNGSNDYIEYLAGGGGAYHVFFDNHNSTNQQVMHLKGGEMRINYDGTYYTDHFTTSGGYAVVRPSHDRWYVRTAAGSDKASIEVGSGYAYLTMGDTSAVTNSMVRLQSTTSATAPSVNFYDGAERGGMYYNHSTEAASGVGLSLKSHGSTIYEASGNGSNWNHEWKSNYNNIIDVKGSTRTRMYIRNTGQTTSTLNDCSLSFWADASYVAEVSALGSSVSAASATSLRLWATSGYLCFASAFAPENDNLRTLGTSSLRWTTVYATNATINTSDVTQKWNVSDSDLGLNFVTQLRPVSYRWKSTVDANGEKSERQRTHYGLIAQEVKATLDTLGKTAHDFAGWCSDQTPQGERQGLRYTELLAPMIKAIQELDTSVQNLTARMEAVESA